MSAWLPHHREQLLQPRRKLLRPLTTSAREGLAPKETIKVDLSARKQESKKAGQLVYATQSWGRNGAGQGKCTEDVTLLLLMIRNPMRGRACYNAFLTRES
jgi:hypothetical protein